MGTRIGIPVTHVRNEATTIIIIDKITMESRKCTRYNADTKHKLVTKLMRCSSILYYNFQEDNHHVLGTMKPHT